MAKAFLSDFNEELVVDHIDGNKTNNNINNLQMMTSEANVQKWFDQNDRRKYKQVIQIDKKTGAVLNKFSTPIEATEYMITNKLAKNKRDCYSKIFKCLSKKALSYAGYYWTDDENYDLSQWKERRLGTTSTRVSQYSKNMEFIATYNSITEAAQANTKPDNVKVYMSGIVRACRGMQKTAYDYIWKYVEEVSNYG